MSRKPNKAEAALMHPAQNIIALKAKSESAGGHVVQVSAFLFEFLGYLWFFFFFVKWW